MTEGTSGFPWVTTIQESIAKEALYILRAVVHEFDLGKTGRIRISGYPPDAPPEIGLGSESAWLRPRTEVAKMLVLRGVLLSANAQYVGGSPYISDADIGDWLFIEADEQTVRDALKEFEGRFKPKPAPPQRAPAWESLPQNVRNALPTPQPAMPQETEKPTRVPREFKEGFFKGAGEHAGKWVMGGMLLVIIMVIGYALRWWQNLVGILNRHS